MRGRHAARDFNLTYWKAKTRLEDVPAGVKDAFGPGRSNYTIEYQEWSFLYELMKVLDKDATW